MDKGSAVAIEPIVPLTDRILMRLGQPRAAWILIWGLLMLVAYEAPYRLYHIPLQSSYFGIGYSIVAAYQVILSLWGIGKIARRLNANQPLITDLSGGAESGPLPRPFRFVGSVAGPLLLSLAANLVWVADFMRHPGATAMIVALALYVVWFPVNCSVWVCVTLFLGLDSVGRRPLQLKPFHQDRSLGLGPLGRLAFSAFLLLTALLIPFMVVAAQDVRSAMVGLGYIFADTVFFFMSVYRLHRQLVAAKSQYLSHVGGLYAHAFRPLESAWSLDALSAQTERLLATEVLERKIASIHEWPFDAAILARVAAIVTSVLGIIAARLILSRFGL